ncbi:hypothetical protein NADFUDRAFT_42563 [Nadsonia fulvescens var. elongata DSM 6958]|uniref:Uncharacterized protein n=1 Tax=Nadsonia fulvescens var. elongata DSM 6958 TaxID=857566 RepID=A0A1E3PIU5_9ASCO|nr:hypothetical protein NADFUDRAFT_42563 [Nadsonia fulvescens var. elongata DSM 6958]
MSGASFPSLLHTGQTTFSSRAERNGQFDTRQRRAVPPTSPFTFTSPEGQENMFGQRQDSVSPIRSHNGIAPSPTPIRSVHLLQRQHATSALYNSSFSNINPSNQILFSPSSPKKGLGSSGPAGQELRNFRTINDQVLREMNERARQIAETGRTTGGGLSTSPSPSSIGIQMFNYTEVDSGQNKPRTPSRRSSMRHRSRSSIGSSSPAPLSSAASSKSANRFSLVHNQGFAKMESIAQHYAVNCSTNGVGSSAPVVQSEFNRRDSTSFLVDRTRALALDRVGDTEDDEMENEKENRHGYMNVSGDGLLESPIKRDNIAGKTSPVKRRKVDQWGNKIELTENKDTVYIPPSRGAAPSGLGTNGPRVLGQNYNAPISGYDNKDQKRSQDLQYRQRIRPLVDAVPLRGSKPPGSLEGVSSNGPEIQSRRGTGSIGPSTKAQPATETGGDSNLRPATKIVKQKSYGMLPRSQTASKIPRNVSLKGVSSTLSASPHTSPRTTGAHADTNARVDANVSGGDRLKSHVISGGSLLKPATTASQAGLARPRSDTSTSTTTSRIPRSVL